MKFYFSISYYSNVSEQLIQNLSNRLSGFYRQISFLAVNKNSLTIGKLFRFKDEIPACVRSSVIYKFTCEDCNAFYLGCTRQRLKTRIHRHLSTSERSGLALTNSSHSQPRNHSKQFKHNISANNFRFVSTASPTDLSILETMHIHKETPTLNIHQQATKLFIITKEKNFRTQPEATHMW